MTNPKDIFMYSLSLLVLRSYNPLPAFIIHVYTIYMLFFVTPWTAAHQAPVSMGFPRQEYWSGLPFSSPGDLHNPGIEPVSSALACRFFTAEPTGKPITGFEFKSYLN